MVVLSGKASKGQSQKVQQAVLEVGWFVFWSNFNFVVYLMIYTFAKFEKITI